MYSSICEAIFECAELADIYLVWSGVSFNIFDKLDRFKCFPTPLEGLASSAMLASSKNAAVKQEKSVYRVLSAHMYTSRHVDHDLDHVLQQVRCTFLFFNVKFLFVSA